MSPDLPRNLGKDSITGLSEKERHTVVTVVTEGYEVGVRMSLLKVNVEEDES